MVEAPSIYRRSSLDRWRSHRLLADGLNAAKSADALGVDAWLSSSQFSSSARCSWP
jgi:hypothetical protein